MKIAVFGANGRVGSRVVTLAKQYGAEVIEIEKNTVVPDDCDIDVVIDFSTHIATKQVADFCIAHNCSLVTGVTGRTLEEKSIISSLSCQLPVIASENFSEGVAVLRSVAKYIKQLLPQWDCEIIETHHRNKADCPSGTALAIAKDLCNGTEFVLDGRNDKRGTETAAIHSLRCGSAFGIHSVIFGGQGESITICHNAESVDLFAIGAIKQACVLTKNTLPFT